MSCPGWCRASSSRRAPEDMCHWRRRPGSGDRYAPGSARRSGTGPAGAAAGGPGLPGDRCRERAADPVARQPRHGHRGRGRGHRQLRAPAGRGADPARRAGARDQLPGPVPAAAPRQERPRRRRERRPGRAFLLDAGDELRDLLRPLRKARFAWLAASPGMPSHGVYLGRERCRLDDGRPPPRGHREKIGVVGHHDERSDLGSEVENQVVFMIRTVMDCPRHLIQDAAAAVFCCSTTVCR